MTHRAAIAARLDAGDDRGAWVEMARIIGHDPSTADCHVVSQMLERLNPTRAGLTGVRVAILASVTAEPIAPVLAARGVPSHLAIRTYVAAFDQWTQEALDAESGLYGFAPDVVILALRLEEVAPRLASGFLDLSASELQDAVDRATDRVGAAVSAIRSRSAAKILLHAMVPPVDGALGMIDGFSPDGQRPAVRRLNEGLARACAAAGDAYLVDVERLASSVGAARWHDARLAALAGFPFTPAAVHALASEFLRYIRAFAGRVRKVLVTDLDDTLWGGIVGELGVDGVRIGRDAAGAPYLDLQRALLGLTHRGVLLAIDSKNDEDEAMAVLNQRRDMLLRREHFSAVRINWLDKADNLIAIAAELNVGLDSLVYIDDSAAECERVRAACPDVLAIHLPADVSVRADLVRGLGVFDRLSYTDDDRERAGRYQAESGRRQALATAQSIEDFYRSLDMEMQVEPVTASTLARAAELTSRTNQFNLTTRRFTADALAAHLASDRHEALIFRLADRFGDHGWIGLAIVEQRGEVVELTDFLISCRVLKRTVETAMLAVVRDWAAARGAQTLRGSFVPTPRNRQAATFYTDHGFARAEPADAETFERSVGAALSAPEWIRVRKPEAVAR